MSFKKLNIHNKCNENQKLIQNCMKIYKLKKMMII